MKKKLLLALVVSVLLVGCGSTDTTDNAQGTEAQKTQEEQKQEETHTHTYTEAITTEATCEADGLKTFTCECGDNYTEAITATGHNYEEVADSAKEATCDTDGKEADTKCSLCENVVEGAVITASGHTYGDYVYNNDATTSADGTETATCSVCGGKDTRTKAGTKIEVSYDGYDEFGNGYVWCYDGAYAGKRAADSNPYKVFGVSNPYPINQAVWVSDQEAYSYTIYGEGTSLTLSLQQEMAQKNGIPFDDRIKTQSTYMGLYNGKMVVKTRIYIG